MGYPFVHESKGQLHMWYGTHLEWGKTGHEVTHAFREARSFDGITWTPSAEICVPVAGGEEFAISRPWIFRHLGRYRMLFARRFAKYRMGSAYSSDGLNWVRDDTFSFVGHEEEWEAGEQTYPSTFSLNGRTYLLYNGAGYGRSGFGLAVLEAEAT
ncbi:hypothetical protein [Neorhizobium galegae]|uniref:hypothetical protein n=1 Tax=Neorhizobium galegae TaxID=399 RepID=UPI00126D5418|nr:hypothetical protein [Neorhizobium galegae]KAA9383085.1 hypothetical protein F4V88_22280 [Neorhizobium galegae]MCM2501599.1 hypothetical protein [Neorhizobium galegae]MCQ1780598.1 hypothetical protein [Neorhizobium galegae]MCQ1798476.1 hypothetical protein [Neorhizobium galegae]